MVPNNINKRTPLSPSSMGGPACETCRDMWRHRQVINRVKRSIDSDRLCSLAEFMGIVLSQQDDWVLQPHIVHELRVDHHRQYHSRLGHWLGVLRAGHTRLAGHHPKCALCGILFGGDHIEGVGAVCGTCGREYQRRVLRGVDPLGKADVADLAEDDMEDA